MGEVVDLEGYRRARRGKSGVANRRRRAKRPPPPTAPCDGSRQDPASRAPEAGPAEPTRGPTAKRDEPDSKP
ncbi:MAG: hypothetical protein ACE5DS_02465 [Kiloniellaceae bacterium]